MNEMLPVLSPISKEIDRFDTLPYLQLGHITTLWKKQENNYFFYLSSCITDIAILHYKSYCVNLPLTVQNSLIQSTVYYGEHPLSVAGKTSKIEIRSVCMYGKLYTGICIYDKRIPQIQILVYIWTLYERTSIFILRRW